MERVRRQTRPYVGAMDWYDVVDTNPFSSPIRYIGQVDMDEYFYPDHLWRWRSEQGLLYEEVWNCKQKSWNPTKYLSRIVFRGEPGVCDLPIEQAMKLIPEAFENKEENI
jgi:hypothetical protein